MFRVTYVSRFSFAFEVLVPVIRKQTFFGVNTDVVLAVNTEENLKDAAKREQTITPLNNLAAIFGLFAWVRRMKNPGDEFVHQPLTSVFRNDVRDFRT